MLSLVLFVVRLVAVVVVCNVPVVAAAFKSLLRCVAAAAVQAGGVFSWPRLYDAAAAAAAHPGARGARSH